jgi:hypothetical protein
LAGAFLNEGGLFGHCNDRKLMKMTKWIVVCLLALALAPVGCSKKESEQSGQPQAVTIDVPKLKAAFASAAPELQALSAQAIRDVEFGRSYSSGLAVLDKLANAPGLTEDQKKVVDEVTAQVKKIMAPPGAPPAQ